MDGTLTFSRLCVALATWVVCLMAAAVFLVGQSASADPSVAETCYILGPDTRTTAPRVNVTVGSDDSAAIRAGDPIAVSWHISGGMDASCRTPLYLVISFPVRTRFEGSGFIAMPGGAPGPYQIDHDLERTRVFLPLHLGDSMLSGQFKAMIYGSGDADVDWALVEVGKSSDTTGVRVLVADENARVRVRPARAEIVIRDTFTTAAPDRTVISNSNEFELAIHDGFYRVLDRSTGALVLERNGRDPNFSPTSRFVAAFPAGVGFEVIDLYSGTVVVDLAQLVARGFLGMTDMVAWTHGDAYVALSVWGWAGIHIQPSLVENPGVSFPGPGCHACNGYSHSLILDLDAGVVATGAEGVAIEFHSLYEGRRLSFQTMQEALGIDGEWGPSSEDEQKIVQRLGEEILRLGTSHLFDPLALAKRLATGGWQLGGPVRSSHCHLETCTTEDLQSLVVSHQEQQSSRAAASSSDIKGRDSLAAATRGAYRPSPVKAASGPVIARLADLGLVLSQGSAPAVPRLQFDGGYVDDFDSQVVGPIVDAIPLAADVLRSPDDPSCAWDRDEYSGEDKPASRIGPEWMKRGWHWESGGEHTWLLHLACPHGASSRSWLFLLRGSEDSLETTDLFHLLRSRGGPELDLSSSWEYGQSGSTDDAMLIDERYLITSGAHGWESRGWVLVYDLVKNRIVRFIQSVPDPALIAGFYLHDASRSLVQINTNGRIYGHSLDAEEAAFHGYYMDDEVILYTDQGYYDATPEGADFVFLRFAGVQGYHSFAQFDKVLRRPDVIKSILAGESASEPDPDLISPPVLSLSASIDERGAAGRVAALTLKAESQRPLATIRLLQDGQVVEEIAVAPDTTSWHATIERPLRPQARWLTSVAVDSMGYASVPQTIPLPPAKTPLDGAGRLHVLAVGTDTYDDRSLLDLSLARKDAKDFIEAVTHQAGYYAGMEAQALLDEPDLRSVLLHRLQALASKADKQDTIALFIAGHGVRDAAGRFYLATPTTDMASLAETSISWEAVADVLSMARARVIVFLDACHSGAAGRAGTNDGAVDGLLGSTTPMVVIAASKGRQFSQESAELGGGVFTATLAKLLTVERAQTDANQNGTLEISELYGALKQRVVDITNGRQTPWIARNLLPGEVPLF